MHHETGRLTLPDGVELFTRRWTPDVPPRATVLLLHGVHEHSGRYAYPASLLMAHGIEVRAYDHRGHGQSGGAPWTVDSFDEYVADAAVVLATVRGEVAGRPLFLMGHSMGGLVAAAVVVDHGCDGLAGVVLSSPALRVDAPAPLRAVAPLLSRWLPGVPASRLDTAQLSRDARVGRAYREDPLCRTDGVRARLGYEILRTADRVRERPDAFTAPLYLFHGTADRLTDPDGSRWLAAHAATADVTLTLYDGLRHETMNEPERDRVVGDLAAWIAARAPATPPQPPVTNGRTNSSTAPGATGG